MIIKAEISVGELLDKISILHLKKLYIKDDIKLENIHKEYYMLWDICTSNRLILSDQFDYWLQTLIDINNDIWKLENRIRELIKNPTTDEEYIKVSKAIHNNNDYRFITKTRVNKVFGSDLIEEKSHQNLQENINTNL